MNNEPPIEALIHLVQDTVEYCRANQSAAPAVIEALERFKDRRLWPIYERTVKAKKLKYVVSLVGLTNVGKSTLMEALLSVPAPRKNGPATAIPVEYGYADQWSLSILHKNTRFDRQIFDNANKLSDELREVVVDVLPAKAANIECVFVDGPISALKEGLVMADTPGFGAAQTGEDDGSHQRRLEDFIQNRIDRIYFCVAAGDTWTISDAEKIFYEKISPLCGHVVVTKWEGSESQKEIYQSHYEDIFSSSKFVFTNAKRSGNQPDDHGLPELMEIMLEHGTPEKRKESCEQELLAAWNDFHIGREKARLTTQIPWRWDSLKWFETSVEAIPHLAEIRDKLTSLKK